MEDNEDLSAKVSDLIALARSDAISEQHRELVVRALRRIQREVFPFQIAPHTNTEAPLVDASGLTKLHLGSGPHSLSGFLNVDLFPPADLIWDARVNLPLETETIEVVFSEHFLEHVDRDFSARNIMREIFRVMKKGGQLTIGVPDAEKIVRAFAAYDKASMDEFRACWYGKRNLENAYPDDFDIVSLVFHDEYSHERYNPHLWGYSEDSLSGLLQQSGFSSIRRLQHPPMLANEKRHFGSIYLEAIKGDG